MVNGELSTAHIYIYIEYQVSGNNSKWFAPDQTFQILQHIIQISSEDGYNLQLNLC